MVTNTTAKSSQQYEVHPAANLFPMMSDAEYEGLKQDIAENGQRESIVVWCNQLIDGRNRLRAMEELGRQPDIAELDEDQDPWKYVISHNLHRRHLTTSQRSMIAAKMANLKHGDVRSQKNDPQNCGSTSTEDAAKLLNVSERSIESAKQVIKSADAKVIEAVEQGAITVNKAVTLVLKKPAKTVKEKKPKETVKISEQEQVKLSFERIEDYEGELECELAELVEMRNPLTVCSGILRDCAKIRDAKGLHERLSLIENILRPITLFESQLKVEIGLLSEVQKLGGTK